MSHQEKGKDHGEKGHHHQEEEKRKDNDHGKKEKKDDCSCCHESAVIVKSNPDLEQLLTLLSQPIPDAEKERITLERRAVAIHQKPAQGIAPGAPPRPYYGRVKEVATMNEATFASEFGVDFDAFIAEGARNNQLPPGTTPANIDRNATLAAMHRFALHGLDSPIEWIEPRVADVPTRALSSCQEAIVTLGIEAVVFVLNALGLPGSWSVGRQVLAKVSTSGLTGLTALGKAFGSASSAWAKAVAAVDLVLGIFSLTGLNTIVNILWSSVSWWQWLIMGAWIVIQLFAWFASAGLSTIAYLAGVVLSAATLIYAGVQVGKNC